MQNLSNRTSAESRFAKGLAAAGRSDHTRASRNWHTDATRVNGDRSPSSPSASDFRHYRRTTPAERMRVKWFLVGAFVTQATNLLIAIWIIQGGAP